MDWNIYLTELQSIVLYYNNNKQPQLQDPWNEPLALVWCFYGGAADGEGDGPPPALVLPDCYLGPASGGLIPGHRRGSTPSPPTTFPPAETDSRLCLRRVFSAVPGNRRLSLVFDVAQKTPEVLALATGTSWDW